MKYVISNESTQALYNKREIREKNEDTYIYPTMDWFV